MLDAVIKNVYVSSFNTLVGRCIIASIVFVRVRELLGTMLMGCIRSLAKVHAAFRKNNSPRMLAGPSCSPCMIDKHCSVISAQ